MSQEIPLGFQFAGVHCGVKRDPAKKDMTVVVSDRKASAAGVFTTNRVCAAPVHLTRSRVPAGGVRGVVINSGNANACTGHQGRRDAEAMTLRLAKHLHCEPAHVLVCSTGVIGRPMPMETIERGIDHAYAAIEDSWSGVEAAAAGILTTDAVTKIVTRSIVVEDKEVRLLGICKGAAMIGPNMATMLGLILTDATASPELLDRVLRQAVDRSFHCISVEGHTSTNDTVLLLANGASGVAISPTDGASFVEAVCQVAEELARKIAEDAEGASHLIQIDVTGTRNDEEARKIAKAVADSPLVKTAVYGADPNWGRICSAAGYAGVEFEEDNLSLRVNGTLLYDHGAPTPFDPATESRRIRENRRTHIELILDLGKGRCRFWTCDLTVEYVRFNADYTT